MTKEELIDHIAENRLDVAIKALKKATANNDDDFNNVNTLSASFHALKEQEIKQLISAQELKQHRSQITTGLLTIAQKLSSDVDIPVEYLPPPAPPVDPPAAPSTHWAKWMLVGFLFLGAGTSVWWFFSRQSAPQFEKIAVNLHGPNGYMDNPLKAGWCTISAVESSFQKEAQIDTSGQVIFDSIPGEILGGSVVFKLNAGQQYKLKEPKQEYKAGHKINIEVEAISTPPKTSNPKTQSIPHIDCPTKMPNGKPLGSDKPSGTQNGYTAVAGHYNIVNGTCKWVPGGWRKNTKGDCPNTTPPAAPVNRNGRLWYPGYFVQDGDYCVWVAGRWEPPTNSGPPPPVYVPPPPQAHPAPNGGN